MDKQTAIEKAGSARKLAAILGVTPQAVGQWESIPPLRLYQLKEKKPRWFSRPRKPAEQGA